MFTFRLREGTQRYKRYWWQLGYSRVLSQPENSSNRCRRSTLSAPRLFVKRWMLTQAPSQDPATIAVITSDTRSRTIQLTIAVAMARMVVKSRA